MHVERLAADTLRVLAMDAVQKANSGHPGMPMGMADLAVVLWTRFLRVDPDDPRWPDRDRFVLSNGHGSMLLYGLLHLAGFDVTIDDLKAFRQWGSPTPGHPERDPARGIEMTTGPLGQGFATGVGMAVAEERLRAVFGPGLVDHRVYAFVSDGDLMEGVAGEAASLAGHLALGRLVYLYDHNHITIEGSTSLAFSEDVAARFTACGWHTLAVDGHDQAAVAEALEVAIAEEERPSLLICHTHIGYGAPTKQDTAAAHGAPLGEEEIARAKELMGWELPPFVVPDEVYEFFRRAMDRGREAHRAWRERRDAAFAADPELAARWTAYHDPEPVRLSAPVHPPGTKVATRKLSGEVLQELAELRPDLVGGSADLAPSTNTIIRSAASFSAEDRLGRNLHFGVREHAMGAIVNGLTLHGGVRAYGATFLVFSDYMRAAVRLGALMETPSVWVWTHDSVFLGEDGPTHQPVEHLMALRGIPGLWVVRPADPTETAVAWELAMNREDGPTAIVLTRQGVPVPATPPDEELVRRGGYVRRDGGDVTLAATGSEVAVAEEAAVRLDEHGVSARVVSLPCLELFDAQDEGYRRGVLPPDRPIVTLEAGITRGWERYATPAGALHLGIDHFGASAPWEVIAAEFGFTGEAVADRVAEWLERRWS
ncbi:MAG TPA: transketolase [Actinobacteria bacterium]|nr:transketolase [Actinomycetota bacterium]